MMDCLGVSDKAIFGKKIGKLYCVGLGGEKTPCRRRPPKILDYFIIFLVKIAQFSENIRLRL